MNVNKSEELYRILGRVGSKCDAMMQMRRTRISPHFKKALHIYDINKSAVITKNRIAMLIGLPLRSFLLNLMVSALLSACAGATQPGKPSIPPPATTQPQPQGSGGTITPIPQITLTQEATTTMPGPFPSTENLEDNPLVSQAKQNLAQRLDVPIEDIELVQYEGVVWPDSSLGCPQPGMAYAQVLTPGYLIILTAGDKEYEYHASKSTEVIYCENPSPPIPGTPGDI